MLDKLASLIGPSPPRVDLSPATVEVVDCGVYVRERVRYSVEHGETVDAYLLIPKNRSRPLPAVFCHHQHARDFSLGKSEVVGLAGDPDQAYAHELAERGFVTFAPDAIAFEDRNWSLNGQAEFFELTTRLVRGQTLLAKVLHDVSVGIDYLVSRPEVDAARIGFIGHSYGGRMALWAPAVDGRIMAAVSHCGCIPFRDSFSHDTGIQAEFCVPGIANQLDIEDVVRAIAPRSLLLSGTRADKWSSSAQQIFDACLADFPAGELQLSLFEGGHTFEASMRTNAYEFLGSKLARPSPTRHENRKPFLDRLREMRDGGSDADFERR